MCSTACTTTSPWARSLTLQVQQLEVKLPLVEEHLCRRENERLFFLQQDVAIASIIRTYTCSNS